ncbi:hypothetical protein OTU49_004865 [Cherax quadricarinatus]|uniref:Sulfotransferase domain-containing protein n=2 Tax=Cherax quadricarinatus TaxID=27406 RepID=A0AAW0XDR6_CHEQU|nr:uncharacterized protein LOC128697584 isoform X2 [Cherax quadricarinatus]
MVPGVRKKHWLLLSLSITGVLVLLIFTVNPLNNTTAFLPAEAEVGFLRRRIANDDSVGGTGARISHPGLQSSLHSSNQYPPPQHSTSPSPQTPPPPRTPFHLTKEKREELARQGVLLIEDEEDVTTNDPRQLHVDDKHQQTQQQQPQQKQKQPSRQSKPKQQKIKDKHLQNDEGSQHKQWLHQIDIQHKEFLKQQHKLQEHHLRQTQLLQQKLQQQETTGQHVSPDRVVPLPGEARNSSKAFMSKVSQTNQDSSATNIVLNKKALPPLPHISYDNLKKQGENIIRHIVRREYMTVKKDINFIPGEMVEPSQVRRAIILSTWRSGSSYLGDLIKAYPGTFFSFEPLHRLLKNLHLEEGPLVEEVVRLLRAILTCDYSQLDAHVNYLREATYLQERNTRLWNSCALNRALCFDKDYISKVCRYMPLNVVKTVRMGLSPVVELLQDPSLNLYVVHLVRDPRGCLHSRMQIDWCLSDACSNPETVCKDLLTDLTLSKWVKENFPDRYLMVRYEDLGLRPEVKAREIFNFLGVSYNKYVSVFIREHTSGPKLRYDNAYSTFRNSKATIFAWRRALNYTTVEAIQEVCEQPLQRLHLRIFRTEEEYLNTTIPVLLT